MPTKIELRPTLEISILKESAVVENFQNQTLRPILKLQNELYLSLFKSYLIRQKVDFKTFTKDKKRVFIEQSLQKDLVLKNTFIGITIGMFTSDELDQYLLESKEFNRRIVTMLMERIKSQVD